VRNFGRHVRLIPELIRVLAILPGVEIGRRRSGPGPLLRKLRTVGKKAPHRDAAARARLRIAIAWADAHFPTGPNCYRRALLEIALDQTAAAEPIHMGIRIGGAGETGHAWLGQEEEATSYDAVFTL